MKCMYFSEWIWKFFDNLKNSDTVVTPPAIGNLLQKTWKRTGKMSQLVRASATNPDNLNSIPGTHLVEEKQLSVFLWSTWPLCISAYPSHIYSHMHTHLPHTTYILTCAYTYHTTLTQSHLHTHIVSHAYTQTCIYTAYILTHVYKPHICTPHTLQPF